MNMNDALLGSLIFNKNEGGGVVVPYVYSTGKQYVALPFYSDDDFVIEAKIAFTLKNAQGVYIGDGGWFTNSFVLYNESNGNLDFRYGPYNPGVVTIPAPTDIINTFHDITMDSAAGTLVFDGVQYGGITDRQHLQVGLFGQNTSDRLGYCGFAYIKVYKNGDFYLNLVPMYDKENNAGYLYDTISKQSYYSLTATPLKYAEPVIVEEGGVVLINKNIDESGVYNASNDNADGYSSVMVNIPKSGLVATEFNIISTTYTVNS